MYDRFNGNVEPFASSATGTNRTIFGDTVQSDSINDNLNADFKTGWEIVGLNDNPTREDFNAMGYTLGYLISYLYQNGVAEYNLLQEYKTNSIAIGADGTIYQSLVDSNIGNALTDTTKWKNVTSSFVDLVNNQSIDGIKTFVKSPKVPTPTTGTQAVNKDYVDSLPVLPIGTILNGYTIFDNCIVAFGGEFNRADYPKLWTYLQANPTLVKTQTQWQTEATANGGICGFFSDGNGTTTFRVPNLDKAFLRPDSRVVGTYQGDAIRNITAGGLMIIYGNSGSGAFKTNRMADGATMSTSFNNYGSLGFDASLVVPTANENRPKNIAILPLIVAK